MPLPLGQSLMDSSDQQRKLGRPSFPPNAASGKFQAAVVASQPYTPLAAPALLHAPNGHRFPFYSVFPEANAREDRMTRRRAPASHRPHLASGVPRPAQSVEDVLSSKFVLPPSSGLDVDVCWSNLPAENHRARYQNELSKRGNCRGALEGRTSDYPSVKIRGLDKVHAAPSEVSLTIYVCTSDGRPHPFFYCKTAGRDAPATCLSTQLPDGTHVLRLVARASNGYSCELRHVGIVRLRQGQDGVDPNIARQAAQPNQANFFRLRVLTDIENADGQRLAVTSDAIKCISSTQSVLKPKINQIVKTGSLSDCGKVEVFIFGKDFTPNTKFRVFQKLPDDCVWQDLVDDEDCTWVCTHHCCAKVRLPKPPLGLSKEGEDIAVKLEGVPHSARRPAASLPPNWNDATNFSYPADAPRASLPSLVRKVEDCAMVARASKKRAAENESPTLEQDNVSAWVPGRSKSPRSSPQCSPEPLSPSSPDPLTVNSPQSSIPSSYLQPPHPLLPPANFAFPTAMPTQPGIFNYPLQMPVQGPGCLTPGLTEAKDLAQFSGLNVWGIPNAQPMPAMAAQPEFFGLEDLSPQGSPSDFSSNCSSPSAQNSFESEEDLPWSLLDSLLDNTANDNASLSNQAVPTALLQ